MSAFQINPLTRDFMLRFSAEVTWGISPMVLGENAHCRGGMSVVCTPSTGEKIMQVAVQHGLIGATEICRRLPAKGEGRAKA